MSWQDIVKEDNISKIRLAFGRKNKQNSNEEVKSRFQQSINNAKNMSDIVVAMEQFAQQPSAKDIWEESGEEIPLAGAIKYAKEAASSSQQIKKPQSPAQQFLLQIRAAYRDDELDGGAKEQALLLEHIDSLSQYFSRAFGIRDKFMEIVSSNPKEINTLFDKTVQERKAEMQAEKQPQQTTLDQFNTPPPQQPPQQPPQPQEQRQTTLGEFGKMDWFESLKAHCATEKSNPMDRVTTTTSTGQDEEAAKRTKDDEKELLARILERNKKARES